MTFFSDHVFSQLF